MAPSRETPLLKVVMDAGLRLKRRREKLGLRYRQVEQASHQIAERRGSQDYVVGLSRLADIENKGVMPTLQRLYSLCAIYRLSLHDALAWYGLTSGEIMQDGDVVHPENTHPVDFDADAVTLPLRLDSHADFRQTSDLSRMVQQWGKIPLALLDTLNLEEYRYALIGAEDYLMYPLLQPGALVQVDEKQTQIEETGWIDEFERPIYFFELRNGYACCWCDKTGEHLILQPHPRSPSRPVVLRRNEADVLGRVVGVATKLGPTRLTVEAEARPYFDSISNYLSRITGAPPSKPPSKERIAAAHRKIQAKGA